MSSQAPSRSSAAGRAADAGARPARHGRGWILAGATVVLLGMALGSVLFTPAGAWETVRVTAKRGFAGFLAGYAEMYATAAQDTEAAEYVVFLGSGDPAGYRAFFAADPALRLEREGGLPGTLVVTLVGEGPDGLERLRAQPFVKLLIRNRGALFCH